MHILLSHRLFYPWFISFFLALFTQVPSICAKLSLRFSLYDIFGAFSLLQILTYSTCCFSLDADKDKERT
ncbi:hypothetical protein F5Y16DRAFT_376752 [Xylariaceae sp. FL0255]|nr:hypothetical protein F5Y16DRAFT_376752 [Xylariaceae sp. FL0255]